jgi:acetylornithine deacetylase
MNDYLYETARRLVAFDTVSAHSDRAAIDYLAGELRARKFNLAVQSITAGGIAQANLIAWIGPPRENGLIISAHVDTVPYQGQPGWTREPLKLERENDRIFGRGTSDMKGFIAQCLDAAARLDAARLRRPLVFVFTASEEVGCLGAEQAGPALKEILGATPVPRLCWIGEPTSWQVAHAHKSIVAFQVTVRGRGGHSGAPASGVNAIAVMGMVMDAIGNLMRERRDAAPAQFKAIFPAAPYDVLNFGTIHGGIALNMIAEECALRISYRSLPDADPLELYHDVERRLRGLDARDFAGGPQAASIELERPMVVPPLLSPRGTALEAALFAAAGAENSGGVLFGTDGGWFSRSGIVSLICGPGDLDQAHQPNECIRRDAFEGGTAIALEVIERLCCAA